MIELRNVTKVHHRGPRAIEILREIDLRVAAGEFVTVMGPSGSGKSTLLNLLGGLDVPTTGSVVFRGHDLRLCSDRQRSLLRRQSVGFVFQRSNLLPTLTAAENVALPLWLDGVSRSRAIARALDTLGRLRLCDRAGHFPDALSGGEMQRVALARALVNEPGLVLCDEPTGSLDSANGHEVLALLRALPEPGRRSVVMVTHDREAASLGDRTLSIRDGRIESHSPVRGRYARAAAIA